MQRSVACIMGSNSDLLFPFLGLSGTVHFRKIDRHGIYYLDVAHLDSDGERCTWEIRIPEEHLHVERILPPAPPGATSSHTLKSSRWEPPFLPRAPPPIHGEPPWWNGIQPGKFPPHHCQGFKSCNRQSLPSESCRSPISPGFKRMFVVTCEASDSDDA